MKNALSYPLSVIFWLNLGLILIIFHPLQVIALKFWGVSAQQKMVIALNGCIVLNYRTFLGKIIWNQPHNLPKNQPFLLVANHGHLLDIPAFFWYLKAHEVRFVAKKELAKGIPSVSFNLKYGINALIDRNHPDQAIQAIRKLTEFVMLHNKAMVIFPEGTRSKTEDLNAYKTGGISVVLQTCPSIWVIPVAISGTRGLQKGWRIKPFQTLKWTISEGFSAEGKDAQTVAKLCKAFTVSHL